MPSDRQHRALLIEIARRVMTERGMAPDFPSTVSEEVEAIRRAVSSGAMTAVRASGTDLTKLAWCSIDNDDSLDIDQLTVAEEMPGGAVKILVAIADVDALVEQGRAVDGHAGLNTTSVYTPAKVFPMLPEDLSNGLTSLNEGVERLALVIEMVASSDGAIRDSAVYRARVVNKAKLAYNAVAAWLDGSAPAPAAIEVVTGLSENLRVQDRVAQVMKARRQANGALTLETIHALPVFDGDTISDLRSERKNRAKDIITGFMLAANGVTARYLSAKGYPSIRRVVRTPERWDRIGQIAAEHGATLPERPDSRSLEEFLIQAKDRDPLRFPDLSLAVVKLLGAGEYAAESPGDEPPGHFGLAVRDYGHSTAPNRRYTDLVTQRLLKAALLGARSSYNKDDLGVIAKRCTEMENTANKVERQVSKSAAALLLQSRTGEGFDAIITGAGPKGTWARLVDIPVDGKVDPGSDSVDVGDRVRVRLVSVDVEKGYVDFALNKGA